MQLIYKWAAAIWHAMFPPELTMEEIQAAALRINNPAMLDGSPMHLTQEFLDWMKKWRPGAAEIVIRWLSQTDERMREIPWGGDWLIYFPNLSPRDVPENVFHWFWFPSECPGKTYMYLRSHPSKLDGR